VNVLDFVLMLDERYGENWMEEDLTEGERIIYNYLRMEWNQTFGNCGPVDLYEIEDNH
jgi:hypothetical protein